MQFILEQSDASLTTHSGLALIGLLLAKTHLRDRLNATIFSDLQDPDISHADVAISYLGLLAQGKSDFEHIEPFRDDEFFAAALSCQQVPSAPTLRQRLDAAPPPQWEAIVREESLALLKQAKAQFTPVLRDYVPLDADVSPFDNSNSTKEGVELTYKKVPGYAPIFFYLGREGYLLDLELRSGSTHSQAGTAPLLARGDAARVDYIIKRNLRKESLEMWREIAEKHGTVESPRPGKQVWTGSIDVERDGIEVPLRIVFRVIERTSDHTGQLLLVPTLEVDTYWASLPDEAKTVIRLYNDHGTMEQFHSEIKNELDLERLPSGKFATNSLVLHLGMMAYNLLRLIGQESLNVAEQPVRKKVRGRGAPKTKNSDPSAART